MSKGNHIREGGDECPGLRWGYVVSFDRAIHLSVTPAEAGVLEAHDPLDSRLRGNDNSDGVSQLIGLS